MLADLEKETVEFGPNYDNTRMMPLVLPSKVPNLLVNGSAGIAVGMATNVPPHNMGEICDAALALLEEPDFPEDKLFALVQGPDFPTAGIVLGRLGIQEAYRTGRGRIIVRARTQIEELKGDREAIVITEIPYQVNKAALIERIAELVKDGTLDDIADIRDESDREGMRVVIVLKKDADGRVVENQLYKHTQMQMTFGIIMLALVDNRPEILDLRQIIRYWLEHREEVVVRRTRFDLRKAEERAHILEGLRIALDHIDEIVSLIRGSETVEIARNGLMSRFGMTEVQAQAILDLRLQRLTGLERQKIEDEYQDLVKQIAEYRAVLADRGKVLGIIRDELNAVKEQYGDERRTQIVDLEPTTFDAEDLIAEEDMVITISHLGYVKRLSVSQYRKQQRGGKGVIGIETKEDDFAEHLFIASTHDSLLFFSNRGRCYWVKVHEIPVGGKMAKGKPIVNMCEMGKDEAMTAFCKVREFSPDRYVMMATRLGIIKKTSLDAFSNPRKVGVNAMDIADKEDVLIGAMITDGSYEVVLATRMGMAIRFPEDKVRAMGRTAYGVKGIELAEKDYVIGMVVVKRDSTLLVVCENGYGKRTSIDDYRITNRGGKGVINVKTSERNGEVVSIREVLDEDELILITKQGIANRQSVKDIKVIGRNTQGVRLINLGKDDLVTDVARVVKED